MKNKLLIIDGHNLLFQMFFGMPARIVNKDGIAIQGVLGFVGALNKIISMIEPTHIVVLFDSEQHNDRKDIVRSTKQIELIIQMFQRKKIPSLNYYMCIRLWTL